MITLQPLSPHGNSSRIRFGKQPSEDPSLWGKACQATLANARQFNSEYNLPESRIVSDRNYRKSHIAGNLKNKRKQLWNEVREEVNFLKLASCLFSIVTPTLFMPLIVISHCGAVVLQEKAKIGNLSLEDEENLADALTARRAFLITALSCALPGLWPGIQGARRYQKEVRSLIQQQRKDLHLWEKKLFTVKAPTLEADLSLVNRLEKLIDRESNALAKHMSDFYERESNARPALESVFGSGPTSLPSAWTIKELFHYCAMLKYRDEHPGEKQPKMPQLAFLQDTYILLKTARETGDLFMFTRPNPKALFGETFARDMDMHTRLVAEEVSGWMEGIRTMMRKEGEIDRHIAQAQHLLMRQGLSPHFTAEKSRQVNDLIQRLQEQKVKFQDALKQEDPRMIENPVLISELNDGFNVLVAQLQQAIESNGFELQVQDAFRSSGIANSLPVLEVSRQAALSVKTV